MRITAMTLVACAALLASSAAFAEPKEFIKADANGDGIVNVAEYANSGVEEKKFEELDKNKDGKLNKEEYSAALEECD